MHFMGKLYRGSFWNCAGEKMKNKHYTTEFFFGGIKVVVHAGRGFLRVAHIDTTLFMLLQSLLIQRGVIFPKKLKWKLKK